MSHLARVSHISRCLIRRRSSVAHPLKQCPCVTLWLRAIHPWDVTDRHLEVLGRRLGKRRCARARQ